MKRWIIALVLAFAVSGVILLSMLTERAVATPAQARRPPVLGRALHLGRLLQLSTRGRLLNPAG